jgi:hypothetical protein
MGSEILSCWAKLKSGSLLHIAWTIKWLRVSLPLDWMLVHRWLASQ